jgi:hypothetical protein
LLLFPYAEGVGFIHALRQRRPWATLSAIYQDPPRSTAQILHPERYLDRREDPVPIELPDLAAALPAGSTKVIEEELGELGLGEVLRRFLGDAPVAAAWRGDRYALWDVPASSPLLMWLSAWGTTDEAREFVRTYARVMVVKHALPPPPEGPALDWTVGTRAFLIERRGRLVLTLEGAPPAAVDAVRAAAWAGRVLY